MQYEDTWDHYVIDLQPGVQHLDGRTALQYVRYRDEEGDIGRVARQQKFIKAVLAEVYTPAILLKAPSLIREVFFVAGYGHADGADAGIGPKNERWAKQRPKSPYGGRVALLY